MNGVDNVSKGYSENCAHKKNRLWTSKKGPKHFGRRKFSTEFKNLKFAVIFAYPSLILTSNLDKFANAVGNLLWNNYLDQHRSWQPKRNFSVLNRNKTWDKLKLTEIQFEQQGDRVFLIQTIQISIDLLNKETWIAESTKWTPCRKSNPRVEMKNKQLTL